VEQLIWIAIIVEEKDDNTEDNYDSVKDVKEEKNNPSPSKVTMEKII
jgi:hypothetical protein